MIICISPHSTCVQWHRSLLFPNHPRTPSQMCVYFLFSWQRKSESPILCNDPVSWSWTLGLYTITIISSCVLFMWYMFSPFRWKLQACSHNIFSASQLNKYLNEGLVILQGAADLRLGLTFWGKLKHRRAPTHTHRSHFPSLGPESVPSYCPLSGQQQDKEDHNLHGIWIMILDYECFFCRSLWRRLSCLHLWGTSSSKATTMQWTPSGPDVQSSGISVMTSSMKTRKERRC